MNILRKTVFCMDYCFFAAIYLAKESVFNGTSVHKKGEKGVFGAIDVFSLSNIGRRNGIPLDIYFPMAYDGSNKLSKFVYSIVILYTYMEKQ